MTPACQTGAIAGAVWEEVRRSALHTLIAQRRHHWRGTLPRGCSRIDTGADSCRSLNHTKLETSGQTQRMTLDRVRDTPQYRLPRIDNSLARRKYEELLGCHRPNEHQTQSISNRNTIYDSINDMKMNRPSGRPCRHRDSRPVGGPGRRRDPRIKIHFATRGASETKCQMTRRGVLCGDGADSHAGEQRVCTVVLYGYGAYCTYLDPTYASKAKVKRQN